MKILFEKDLKFEDNIDINNLDALIIVDMQNDFMPGGTLAVENGDQIIDDINKVAEFFSVRQGKIVLTQDWHPQNHLSFASNHPGKDPGDNFQTEAIGPILWPDHCVQSSKGAEFHERVRTDYAHAIIRKGYNPNIDSYSGFIENDKRSETGLAGYLKSLNIKRIFICGLALDYCCFSTAMDGVDFGFEVYFMVDLTKGIDLPPGNVSDSYDQMSNKGVKFMKMKSFSK